MEEHCIAVLEGDGIGPEIMREALKVLRVIEARFSVRFALRPAPFGGQAWFEHGAAFPAESQQICDDADAILKGPIGLSYEASQKIPVEERPERAGLLPMRQRYATYANFRPVFLPPALRHFSPLRPDRIPEGIDIIMIRELVGGLYFGAKQEGRTAAGQRFVKETLEYTEEEIRQILVVAFEEARKRKRVVHNVHKSNVLLSSVLWNTIFEEVHAGYPDIEARHIIVDAAATALVLRPQDFDVMVMENMFGDILSDLAGGLLGSLGLMPSACMGKEKSYYEPSHGSAPDIAGQGVANPYSMIGSVALMLEKSFGMEEAARAIWKAMTRVFAQGFSTADLQAADRSSKIIGTSAFGDKVVEALETLLP